MHILDHLERQEKCFFRKQKRITSYCMFISVGIVCFWYIFMYQLGTSLIILHIIKKKHVHISLNAKQFMTYQKREWVISASRSELRGTNNKRPANRSTHLSSHQVVYIHLPLSPRQCKSNHHSFVSIANTLHRLKNVCHRPKALIVTSTLQPPVISCTN